MVWLWMSALLVATTGVSVHQIYCYCVGETTLSLFSASSTCHDIPASPESVADCCLNLPQKKPACCAADANKNDCTRETTQFVQLKTEFLAEKWSSYQLSGEIADEPAAPSFSTVAVVIPKSDRTILPNYPQPPPLSGRMICVRHCLALC